MGGRTVPAAVAELPLALLYGCVQPSCDGVQDARILPNQPTLATTQQGQARIQDQLHVLGVGEEVGRGGHVDDAPGATDGTKEIRVKWLTYLLMTDLGDCFGIGAVLPLRLQTRRCWVRRIGSTATEGTFLFLANKHESTD